MKLAPENDGLRHWDFPALWKRALIVSGALVAISLAALLIGGLDLGIDFEGGTSFELRTDVSEEDAAAVLSAEVAADARIQEVMEGTDRFLRIRSSVQDTAAVDEIRQSLSAIGEITAFESVGPTWGDEITNKARNALFFFFIAIAVYISIRLEWKMAVGALVAVAHDIIISVGVYAVFRFEVTPATVIAFLTIMGYSLYDTIVVYDKVRDITARVGATGRYTYTEMMNLALNQVLARSINTTITSIIPVLSMLILGSLILGATTLQEFSIALLVGLIVGGYSSLFIASFVVTVLKEREPEYEQISNKVAKKGGDDDGSTRTVDSADVTGGDSSKRRTGTADGTKSSGKSSGSSKSTSGRSGSSGGGAPPKPRKSNKTGRASSAPPKPRKTKKN